MTECIDDIRVKIESIKRKTDDSIIDEKAVNAFLDAILHVSKPVKESAKDVNEMLSLMYDYFNYENQDDFKIIKQSLDDLYSTLIRFYTVIRKSSAYPLIKSCVEEYRNSVSELKEFIDDMNLFVIDLPNDEEHRHLVGKINELLA